MSRKRFRVGLALGGGAARGLAHIGVLQALAEADIPIAVIAGTSAGALVGACYALTETPREMEVRVLRFLQSPEFRRTKLEFLRERRAGDRPGFMAGMRSLLTKGALLTSSMTRPSYISEENFVLGIERILEDVPVSSTRVPFAAVALDVKSGAEVVLRSGSLRRAVCASCAIPGVFPPVAVDGKLLVDGGWVDPVPVKPARAMGADFVIAVDISSDPLETGGFDRGVDLVFRTNALARHHLKELQIEGANFVLRPDVGEIHWADFGRIREVIERGRNAVAGSLDAIREHLSGGERKWLVTKLFSR